MFSNKLLDVVVVVAIMPKSLDQWANWNNVWMGVFFYSHKAFSSNGCEADTVDNIYQVMNEKLLGLLFPANYRFSTRNYFTAVSQTEVDNSPLQAILDHICNLYLF